MSRRKYDDFEESDVFRAPAKKYPYEENSYVSLTCPHCKVVFVQLTANDIKTTKASKCLKHLRVCKSYNESVPPPDKKQKDQTTMEQLIEEIKSLKAQQAEFLSRLNKSLDLGPPEPKNETELVIKINSKKKRDPIGGIPKPLKKRLKVALHPDKCDAFGPETKKFAAFLRDHLGTNACD